MSVYSSKSQEHLGFAESLSLFMCRFNQQCPVIAPTTLLMRSRDILSKFFASQRSECLALIHSFNTFAQSELGMGKCGSCPSPALAHPLFHYRQRQSVRAQARTIRFCWPIRFRQSLHSLTSLEVITGDDNACMIPSLSVHISTSSPRVSIGKASWIPFSTAKTSVNLIFPLLGRSAGQPSSQSSLLGGLWPNKMPVCRAWSQCGSASFRMNKFYMKTSIGNRPNI